MTSDEEHARQFSIAIGNTPSSQVRYQATLELIAEVRKQTESDALERAAVVADTEPELDEDDVPIGMAPAEARLCMAAVRVTKKNIAKRIRALKPGAADGR